MARLEGLAGDALVVGVLHNNALHLTEWIPSMATDYDKLLHAIRTGDVNEAQRIIETGLDLNTPYYKGATPLYAAILNGNDVLVRLMLDRGADPNLAVGEPAASVFTEKPLDLAMQARFLMDWDQFHPIVQTLIEYGATDRDGNIESPDELAVR